MAIWRWVIHTIQHLRTKIHQILGHILPWRSPKATSTSAFGAPAAVWLQRLREAEIPLQWIGGAAPQWVQMQQRSARRNPGPTFPSYVPPNPAGELDDPAISLASATDEQFVATTDWKIDHSSPDMRSCAVAPQTSNKYRQSSAA